MKPGDTITVMAETLSRHGDGVARHEGYEIHAGGLLPGETGDVELDYVSKQRPRAHGAAVRRRNTHPGRRQAPCPHHGRCNGCPLMEMDLPSQHELKRRELAREYGVEIDRLVVQDSTGLRYRWSAKRVVHGDPGALVLGSWAFETPAGLATPDSSYTESTLTGNDGSYRLPKLPGGRSQPALLRRFTLVVYKAGYMGYRSDLRSDDHTPRHDFAQRQNRIRLDRFVQGESHARHLVFLGASPQLRRVAQAEIVQAALEMSERTAAKNPIAPEDLPPPAPAPEPALTLPMRLLTRGDIEEWSTQSGTANTYVLAQAVRKWLAGTGGAVVVTTSRPRVVSSRFWDANPK